MSESILGPPPILEDPRDALAAYAVRFHEALGDGHVAASPLGAYLLLAAAASAAQGSMRADLERVLGCSAEKAGEFLAALVAEPPAGLELALGAWHDPARVNEAFAGWYASLPARFGRGPVPSQAEVDHWARLATGGQIESFPLALDPRTAILLASALSVKSPWLAPFGVAPAAELGPTGFSGVREVLSGRPNQSARAIAWTESAGLVGLCIKETISEFLVVSVIAEPTVPPHRVMAAAHEVAALACGRRWTAAWRSLFDFPLGPGHSWDLYEEECVVDKEGQREEFAAVRIPQWKARAVLDLTSLPASGFGEAAAALAELLRADQLPWSAQAAQSTTARFDRSGFSAASVTAFGMVGSARERGPVARGLRRLAIVRFARPFAVVAVPYTPSVWNGVPVFSAWVTQAIEPSTEEPKLGW